MFKVHNVGSNVLPIVCRIPYLSLSVHYSIAEAKTTTTDGSTAELQSYFDVAVGLGVFLTVIVIINVIAIVITGLWLKRRHWMLPCADDLDL